MEEKKEKRVLKVELDDDVKKVSITGLGDDDKVVMMQELSEEDLDEATGGGAVALGTNFRKETGQYEIQTTGTGEKTAVIVTKASDGYDTY